MQLDLRFVLSGGSVDAPYDDKFVDATETIRMAVRSNHTGIFLIMIAALAGVSSSGLSEGTVVGLAGATDSVEMGDLVGVFSCLEHSVGKLGQHPILVYPGLAAQEMSHSVVGSYVH